MENVKIAQFGMRNIAYMPLYMAERLQLFRDAGLNVTIYDAGNDDGVFAEVAKGRAHFGVGDPVFAALGQPHKHQVRIVATLVGATAMWGVTHHAEIKPFTAIENFVGLRVGAYPKPSTAFTMLQALKVRQPRLLKTMYIVEAEIGQQAYLLASDRVDILLDTEPAVSVAARQGLRVVCSLADFYPDLLFSGLMTHAQTIATMPDTISKTIACIQKALTICQHEPEKIIAIGTELFPTTSPGIMREAVERMLGIGAWPAHATISTTGLRNSLRMRQDVGEIGDLLACESAIDQSFAYAARANVS